jgi:RNA polymerase sigma-B factor
MEAAVSTAPIFSPTSSPAPTPTLRSAETLWDEVLRCRDARRRDQLLAEIVVANLDLARSLARRYHRRGEEADDLEQVACLGLTKAVHGFDPARGGTFAAYAVPTILGEIRRHFRDSCWSVRPPRRIQELQTHVTAMSTELQHRLHRPPTAEELAEALEVPVADVHEALGSSGCFTPQSLDHARDDDAVDPSLGHEDPAFHKVENALVLAPLLAELTDRDRTILNRRFVDEWSQQQIADELGITQMQVSRLLRRLLARLRDRLAAADPLPLAG